MLNDELKEVTRYGTTRTTFVLAIVQTWLAQIPTIFLVATALGPDRAGETEPGMYHRLSRMRLGSDS